MRILIIAPSPPTTLHPHPILQTKDLADEKVGRKVLFELFAQINRQMSSDITAVASTVVDYGFSAEVPDGAAMMPSKAGANQHVSRSRYSSHAFVMPRHALMT